MRIPRSVRDSQVERESRFCDFSSQRLFHGLDLFFGQRRQQLSLRAVVSDTMSRDSQCQCLVQMLMDDDLASGQGGAPLGALDLHDQVVKAYGVVLVNRALVSLREDKLQVPVPAGYKRRTPLRCRNGKAAVELGDVVLTEKLVGPVRRFGSGASATPGGVVPARWRSCVRAAPRLRVKSRKESSALPVPSW